MSSPISRKFLFILACFVLSMQARAANPPPTQLFYVPFPEDNQLTGFSGINGAAVDPLAIFVTFSAATDSTVIYYDHWEDGYEQDITNPVQSTTLVFGDGNPSNGYPPGNAGDLIPAGTVFSLRNYVTSTTLQSVLDYDARDKVASYKPISLTKTSFPASTNTLLAGCVEVFEQGLWGTEYRVPVGADMPTSTATATLTTDADIFAYSALSIMAGAKGATVQIDADNNGSFEQTVTLGEGQTSYVTGVSVGGRVVSNNPVQVIFFSGRPGSNYQSRDTSLLPTYRWSSSYYAPVSTSASNGTTVFLYNPGASAITVSYDYRSSASAYTTATVSVPAGGNARVNLAPSDGSTNFGAYHFHTTGATPPVFYAFCAVDGASATTGNNQAYDGGFTLVGQPSLTTQVLVSLGLGRDPYSSTNPAENGNPVWVTTVGNGHTPETIYVDYDGDNAGPLTDPNGNQYDISYSLRELQQQKIFDPDGDQSGMLVYSLNPLVKIAAAWAQDPTVASAGQPGLDVSTLLPPLREGEGGKKSDLSIDADGDGYVSAGDTLEYDIRAVNSARAAIPGPFAVQDALPSDVSYVPGSTRYRYSIGGNWQAWVSIPDNGSGTPFPLDGGGFSVPGNLGTGQQLQVVFEATIKDYASLSGPTVTNSGFVEISPYGLVLPVQWKDVIYGSIGDRVWNDLDGDGVQDAGEAGIAGIDVFADTNNNGAWDAGEPKDTTDTGGNYLLGGLVAGTYTVRVDPADIAAANVGFGPSHDLDGVESSHVASVVLAGAQDRVDADFGYRVGASVGDRVWADRDADGVQEVGEPGINGVRVYIDVDNDNTYDVGEPNTITSGDGTYYIGNLDPGTYNVRVATLTLPAGATQTFDLDGLATPHEASVTLVAAEHRGDLDFGYRGTLSIGDLVWEDVNADGASVTAITYNVYNGRIDVNNSGASDGSDDGFIGSMRIVNGYVDIDNDASTSTPDGGDDGIFLGYTVINGSMDINGNGAIANDDDGSVTYNPEPGIAGVRVFIDIDGDGVFDANEPSAVTDSSGRYSIGNLFNGEYTVRVDTTTLPPSYIQTYDLTAPSDDDAAAVTLSGSSRTDVDFGYRNDATIGDFVWNDRDADGVRDAGEPGIEGVLVYIDADGDNLFDQGVERFAITDVDGYYQIGNLADGTYDVRVEISTLPQGSAQTHDLNGGLDHEASRTLAVSENATDVDFGYRASAAFGDFIWNDLDADGIQDGGGETGISGVRVYADINGNGVFDSATEPSSVTNSAGAYSISNIVPGTYTARVDVSTLPAGMVQTHDAVAPLDHAATFFISASQTRTDIDFGYTNPVTIGDLVWNDLDADGQKDAGEPGLAGVTVTAYNAATDTVAGTTTTDSSGAYLFGGLMPGTYYLVFDKPSGYDASPADRGADASDSDADILTGRTPSVTLTGGQSNLTLDAGFYQPVSIGDFVWLDADADGQQDGGEAGLQDVAITLYRPGFGPDGISGNSDDANAVAATTSAPDGSYLFAGLPPGSYAVEFGTAPGYARSLADQGSDSTDSDANPVTGLAGGIVLAAGQSSTTTDAGYYQPGNVFGHLYIDTNGNGVQDSGEPDLANVSVVVTDVNGNPQTVATDSGGNWTATVPPGDTTANVDETDPDYPAGHTQTEGADPTTVTAVSGANTDAGIDGYFLPGAISGFVLADTDNDNAGDSPLGGVILTLVDVNGDPVDGDPDTAGVQKITATTAGDGGYGFTGLPPGTYGVAETQPSGYNSVSDKDGGDPDEIRPVVVTAGATNTANNFVEEQPGSISGHVLADTDNDGDGDSGIVGVTLTLKDAGGNDIDSDPNTAGVQPLTTTTGLDGSYRFDDLLPGGYQVSETQPSGYGSVSDADGGNPDLIGNITAITVNPGAEVIDRDFIEIELGSISGHVLVGSDPLAGVTLTLLDENGDPVDGDPDTPGVQPITTITNPLGYYEFTGVVPGTYQVGQTQPPGYDSFGDIDGGDLDIIGDITPITILPGEHSEDNDFVETLDTCPDDWDEWKFQHPGETAAGNPDADAYDNFAEFAFAMPYDGGTGSPWLGSTAWIIRPAAGNPSTLEGVFVRPKGAPLNVSYTLQYAATPGDPTAWLDIPITPAMITTVDNGDCTETVTIHDLEALTGLAGGKGIVRIKAELDDDGGGDGEIDHTSHAETEGWTETPLELCCRTYNNPYQRETAFTGTVTSVNGQDLDFAANDDLGTLLASGASYYLEVTFGDHEGQRFDVVSASGNTITLVNDADLHAATAPYNTLTGAPPASLAGDTVSLRRHWTLDEVFPPDGFDGATGSQSTADQVQVFAGGAWRIYWLYDENDADPATARWVDAATSDMADEGAAVIQPGQGMFFNNRSAATSILAYGEVRQNDFIRPLAIGSSLVGGGYPLDQSATGTGSRAMNLADGFFGSRDFKTADSFFLWKADATIGAQGYATYFLLNGAPMQPAIIRWVKVGDASILPRDAEILLLGNRAVFVRSKDGLPQYTVPSPWKP